MALLSAAKRLIDSLQRRTPRRKSQRSGHSAPRPLHFRKPWAEQLEERALLSIGGIGDDLHAPIAGAESSPTVLYAADMDTDPGWTFDAAFRGTQWAWGVPLGAGSGSGDPVSGFTGNNVIGYNPDGNYSKSMDSPKYATTPAFDCSNNVNVTLSFSRWLGVEGAPADNADIQVSADGAVWTTVWSNPTSLISESAWSFQQYDISAVADEQASVYVRWGMGGTDSNNSTIYPGWNLDDVVIEGTPLVVNGPPVLDAVGDRSIEELVELSFLVTASDPDVPSNALTFRLDTGAPAGAAIDLTSGAFTWTPTELQGPGDYPITIRVTDDGTPPLDDFETITVTVTVPIPPLTVDSFSPTDNSLGVPVDANLVIDFGGDAQKGAGNIVIKRSSDGSVVETIAVVSDQVIIVDDLATINPTSDFDGETAYYVQIDAGAFEGTAGNPYGGIASLWNWNFTTVDGRFGAHIVTTSADGANSVFAADVDGDGDMDVLSAAWTDGKIAWYENNGTEDFTTHTIANSIVSVNSVFAADVDGDGDMDVLSSSYDDDAITWYENDGAENFTAHTITTSADDAQSVFAADVDGDGDIDVLSASTRDNKIAWYENDGSENFTAHAITTAALGAVSVFAADLDGDGDTDVLSASRTDDTIAWYENDGAENFTAHALTTSARSANSVFVADVDGDGDMDVLSSSANDQTIAWYENDGARNFTPHVIDNSGQLPYSVFATDMDGDGDMDVLSTSWPDRIVWLENDGAESFTNHTITGSVNSPQAVFAADLDGDGDMDVLSASNIDDTVAWYENHLSDPFFLAPIGGKTVEEDTLLTFTAKATGPNVPTGTLVFSLDAGAPAAAAIDSGTGVFTWTPAEADAPGSYPITVRVSDGGSPPLEDLETILVTVTEVNLPPVLTAIGDQTVAEFAELTFTATASDPNLPGDTFTFSLDSGAPAGAVIDPVTGAFTWTPTDIQGPGVYTFDVIVTDDGAPELSDSENITVTVTDTTPPMVDSFKPTDGNPGVLIDANLVIDFSEYVRKGVGNIVIKRSADHSVVETIAVVSDQVTIVDDLATIDPAWDFVGETAYYVQIDAGAFEDLGGYAYAGIDQTWTWNFTTADENFKTHIVSTSADGAHSVFAADMDDDGDMDILSAAQGDNKIVWYENDGASNFTPHTITTLATYAQSVFAADVDGDGDMDVLSSGGGYDSIVWYENDGTENFTRHVIATSIHSAQSVFAADVDGDGDIDVLSAFFGDDTLAWYENDGAENFTTHVITTAIDGVQSVFAADMDDDGDIDVLSASANYGDLAWHENDGAENFTTHIVTDRADSVLAADVDGDGDMDMLSACPNFGNIDWYENDGAGNFTSRVVATGAYGAKPIFVADMDDDGDIDVLSADWYGTITWHENDGAESFTSHVISASADGATSVFAEDMDGDGDIDVLSASLYDDKIAWYENLNNPPVLAGIGDQTVDELAELTFTAGATDRDGPDNALTFSLDAGAPTGAAIDPTTGVFTWTPTEADGPGAYPITIRVTDTGSPPFEDVETITVTVNEVNRPPVLEAIGDRSVDELVPLTFTAAASDPDDPANTLTFSLDVGAPASAAINPTTGVFTWTPAEADGPGAHSITIRVTDDGQSPLDDFETIAVTVAEVNLAPVLNAISDQTVDELDELTFTASAGDPDSPANNLAFTLGAGAPAGATINATSGVFTWTPTEAQGPARYTFDVIVTDDGGPPELSDSETITITVTHPGFDLSTLDGANGFRLDGIDSQDYSGCSVSSAGDVNGDGFDDLIIGAVAADPNDVNAAGETYVVFGRLSGFSASLDLSTLDGTHGFRLDGVDASDYSGHSVSSARDVNGDGFDDLIIGAYNADPGGANQAGETYVVFGHAGDFSAALDLSTLDGANGFRLDGFDVSGESGISVSSAGDVNGDGCDDLIIGAPSAPGGANWAGETYVVFGNSGGYSATLDLSTLNGANGFRLDGVDTEDLSGSSVSSAGDLNSDGFDDLIIGAYRAASYAGKTYVVFGHSGVFSAVLNLSTLNGANGFRLDGVDAGDVSGRSVSSAGDVNGDGFDDLIIGAPSAAGFAGETYVVFGRSAGFSAALHLSTLDGVNGFRLDGADASDASGRSVSSAGDVNSDGFDDLLIGAWGADPGGANQAGETYVVFGHSGVFSAALDLSTLDGVNGFRLDGVDADDGSGWSASSAGDVNGDSFDDLIIGASSAAGNANYAGETYVVFGGPFNAGVETQLGDSGPNTLTATQGPAAVDILLGGQDDDLLVGDGGPDVLRGGEGDDILAIPTADFQRLLGGNGTDTLRLDGAGVTLDLTTTADNKIVDIERIDLTGTGDNTLTLDVLEVFNLSTHSNMLFVLRDAGDTVNLGGGWTQQADELIGLDTFEVFTQGAATVKLRDPAGNTPPVLDLIGSRSVDELTTLTFTATAADADIPMNTLTFSLDAGAPVGAAIDATGVFTWTPSELDGPGSYPITVRVTDDGQWAFDDFETITITVAEVNLPPVLNAIGDRSVDELVELTFTATATDPDHPANTLSYTLDAGAPAGAVINSTTGAFTWTPTEADGPGAYPITIRVTDNGASPLDDFETITVTVAEVNLPPVLNAIGDQTVDELVELRFTATASDPDVPGDSLTFSLGAGAPVGASIEATSGVFTWTPTDAQGPAVYTFDVIVTDDDAPGLSDSETITVTVTYPAFSLSTLDGANGFRLNGVDGYDESGYSVSSAGDVNGDGFDDVIIGANMADPSGQSSAGETYVVFGQSGGFPSLLELSSLDGTNGFRLDGVDADDRSGHSVSSAGDVNGDGVDDLIIGATRADPDGGSVTGGAYVVFGQSGGFSASLNLSTLDGANGFRLDGVEAWDYSGISVSSAGDVNGDGFHDLIIGAYGADPGNRTYAGETYVVFGQSGGFSASLDLSTLNGANGFRLDGRLPFDESGYSVSSAGDVNGDGLGDLIIGARNASPGGDNWAGETYVVFGQSSGFSPSLSLSSLDGVNGFRLQGIDVGDHSGNSVSSAGDVNGDGFDDLIIGAHGANPIPEGAGGTGETYVVFGRPGPFSTPLDLSTLNGTNGFRIDGVDGGDSSGVSVSSADINGDGFDDLIIGAYEAAPDGQHSAGETYIVFGHSGGFSASFDLFTLDGANGFCLAGVDRDDLSGASVSSAGDVNGDGFDDVIIGAFGADPHGPTGESYVVFGGPFTAGPETQVGDNGANTLTAAQGPAAIDILLGGQDDDLLIGDGGPDTLRGGEGDDTLAIPSADFQRLVGGNGLDTLRLDGAGITLDLTSIADNKIVDIEQIDITGSGVNRLTLDLLEVLNLSTHSNTLVVKRDAGDLVHRGLDWTRQADELIDGDTFQVFTQGAATLKLQATPGDPALTDLSTLDGTNGFRLNGVDAVDETGFSVSSAGDVNGDGFDDVIVSGHLADPGGLLSTGSSYVVFGRLGGFSASFDLSTLDGVNGFRIDGAASADYAGQSVSSAGDVNGDGFDDLIIGAPGADPGGLGSAGSSYVVLGHSGTFSASLDLSTLDGTNGFRIDGIDVGDGSGYWVSSAGDISGDGFDDVIIGAFGADAGGDLNAGETYVVFGASGTFPAAIDLSTLDGTNGFRLDGIDANDKSGAVVSSAGDINGDGVNDLAIGAAWAEYTLIKMEMGETYVVFGQLGPFAPVIDLSTLDGTNGFRLNGIDMRDYAGYSVSSAGDVNGDGFDDLIIGAHDADPAGTGGSSDAGETYVVFGHSGTFPATFDLVSLDGENGFRLDGINADDNCGWSVSSAGDVNADGFDDLLIGAFSASHFGVSQAGETYVVFGHSGPFDASYSLFTLDGANGFRLDGIDAGNASGRSVSSAGDVNGDGFDDVIIGAHFASPNGVHLAGESYVVFGANFTGGAETQVGDSGANTLNAAQGPAAIDILLGGQNNDLLVGDGGSDVLIGGEGDDTLAIPATDFQRLVGGNGIDTLRLDGAGISLDLTATPDNKIVDIEQIDLTGTGDNTLILDALEVLNISTHSNTLVVQRDLGDMLSFGAGWTQQADEVIGLDTFEVFTQGAATLKLQDVTVASPTLTLSITAASVSEGDGPAATTATVTRTGETTDPLVVFLSSDNPTEATVPASVTIPAGQASVTFDLDAVDDAVVDGTQTATITARVSEWSLQTVDSTGDKGAHPSLALNAGGLPRISYDDRDTRDLKYAAFDGVSWSLETVDNSLDIVGAESSLVIDSLGRPHIAYQNFHQTQVQYAHHDGSAWQLEIANTLSYLQMSLALTSQGYPVISSWDHGTHDLSLAQHDGSEWNVTTFSEPGFTGYHTSVAVDADDNPWISYVDATNDQLRLAHFDGTAWQFETVASDVEALWTSLELDSLGRPHISYRDNTANALTYARYDGSAWLFDVVDPLGGVNSMVLDSADRPWISYTGTGGVRFAHFNGLDWVTELVGPGGVDSSLALTDSGQAMIAYYDPSADDLLLASGIAVQSVTDTVDVTDDDTAGITVTPTSGLITTEAGGTATFSVVLESEPTADVVIDLTSDDTSEGTISPAALTFTPSDWDTTRTITVTGVDDVLSDGAVAYTITTAAAVSADSNYSGLNADDVSVINQDNELVSFTVNTTDDTIDANLGNGLALDASGFTSLRAAVMEANALAGEQTIIVPAGTYTLTRTGSLEEATLTGDLDITDDLTIIGAGAGATIIDAANIDRVFDIHSSISVALEQMTITGGHVAESFPENLGGGVAIDFSSTVTIADSILTGNSAIGSFGAGGAIQSSGELTLSNSAIANNSASNDGGGLYVNSSGASTTILNSTFSENTASGSGAIKNHEPLDIVNSAIINNTATSGPGGIDNNGDALLTITNSTISGNSGTLGGGIGNYATTKVFSSTITGNTASNAGGGVWDYGSATFENTIVADNSAPTSPDVDGSITSLGHNLIGFTTGSTGFGSVGDLLDVAPLLGPLADNGGPTLTHALLSGSPAINAAATATAPPTDQRGVARPQGAEADIGAFELNTGGEIHGVKFNDLNGDGDRDPGEPALQGWTIYLDENQNGMRDDDVFSQASTDVPKVIPDLVTTNSNLSIAGVVGTITDVNVTLDITQAYDLDLHVYLISPTGTRVALFNAVGGFEANFTNTVLDDETPDVINGGFAPFTGVYRPEGSLADFDGEDPNGQWNLEIYDEYSGAPTTLNSWSLQISLSEGEPSTPTDAAGAYAFTGLAPDDYTVAEIVPDGWIQTWPQGGTHAVTLLNGEAGAGYEFGAQLAAVNSYALDVSVDGYANDADGDGVFSVLDTTSTRIRTYDYSPAGGEENRGLFEFDLSAIPADETVTSATLDLNWWEITFPVYPTIHFLAYTGDGAVTLADATTTGVEQGSVFITDSGGDIVVPIQPDFIQSLLGTAGQAGFQTRQLAYNGSSISFASEEFSHEPSRPKLLVETLRPAEIHGLAWEDTNGDGIQDAGEAALEGQAVFLDANDDGLFDAGEVSVLTAADGSYSFTGLADGDYNVVLALDNGWATTQPATGAYSFSLNAGQRILDRDFGAVSSPGEIHGVQWHDLDGDRRRDVGEPGMAGVEVYLDLNESGAWDPSEPKTTTLADNLATTGVDETGQYSFSGLAAGTYTVAEIVPTDYAQTAPLVYSGADGTLFKVQSLWDGGFDMDGLDGAREVAFSPDGHSVFVASSMDDALAVFSRAEVTGELTLLEVFKDGVGGVDGLDFANAVTVSPDGRHVYVAGGLDNAVAIFSRDTATGQLTFVDSAKDGVGGADGLLDPTGLAISLDGTHLYVTSRGEDSIGLFSRDAVTGQLTFVEKLLDGVGGIDGLTDASAVVISPDGLHAYVSSENDSGVAGFSRDAGTGRLTFIEVLIGGQNGVTGIYGAISLTISPDGSSVYVTGNRSHAVAGFSRDAGTGQLTFIESFIDGQNGIDGLRAAWDVTVSPDGAFVYVAGTYDNSIVVFSRDLATGQLAFVQQRDDVSLRDVKSVVVSPDGTHVYAAAYTDDSIVVFRRDPGTPAPGPHKVDIASGQIVENVDFGNRLATGEIRGVKWSDLNDDGVRNDGEPLLTAWTVYLDVNNNGQLDAGEPQTVTDAAGAYAFTGLEPGIYTVAEVGQQDWRQTFPDPSQTGIQRILAADGAEAGRGTALPSLSDDGRYVLYASDDPNILPGDTNAMADVFLYDRQSGDTERISMAPGGVEPDNHSTYSSISDDGQFVLFLSDATNLVANDTNGVADLFVLDRQSGVVERVTMAWDGSQTDATIDNPSISGDGRYVVFESNATNLVSNDTNAQTDIFVVDLQSGTTKRVSTGPAGAQSDDYSYKPSISDDGRYVTFASWASNLVPGDTNAQRDIFVHDLNTNFTERVSVDPNGLELRGGGDYPSISGDGRYVAFTCYVSNVVDDDTNGVGDIIIRDLLLDTNERVSLVANGTEANGSSMMPALSDDGRYVAFLSFADNLTPDNVASQWDIFLVDRASGAIRQVDVGQNGVQADTNASFWSPALSGDGSTVAFTTNTTNLVPGDTNATYDSLFTSTTVPLAGTHAIALGIGQVAADIDFGAYTTPPNTRPVLDPIGDKAAYEQTLLTFIASATDPDVPPNTLTYSLDSGAPAGALINASTGIFTWTPTEAQGPASYSITVRVTDNGTPPLDDFETFTITVTDIPTVTGVFFRGSEWRTAFLEELDAQGHGHATIPHLGFAPPVGDGSQLAVMPWANVDQVSVVFDSDMLVEADDLSVLGVNTSSYSLDDAAFSYDQTTFTATWSLVAPLPADKLLLLLDSDSTSGVRSPDGVALDGDWANPIDTTSITGDTFPSGDGAAGGDFAFRANMHPGNVNGDDRVTFSDFFTIRARLGQSPGTSGYNVIHDLNGDARITFSDAFISRARLGVRLPTADPSPPPAPLAAPIAAAVLVEDTIASEFPPTPAQVQLPSAETSVDFVLAMRTVPIRHLQEQGALRPRTRSVVQLWQENVDEVTQSERTDPGQSRARIVDDLHSRVYELDDLLWTSDHSETALASESETDDPPSWSALIDSILDDRDLVDLGDNM